MRCLRRHPSVRHLGHAPRARRGRGQDAVEVASGDRNPGLRPGETDAVDTGEQPTLTPDNAQKRGQGGGNEASRFEAGGVRSLADRLHHARDVIEPQSEALKDVTGKMARQRCGQHHCSLPRSDGLFTFGKRFGPIADDSHVTDEASKAAMRPSIGFASEDAVVSVFGDRCGRLLPLGLRKQLADSVHDSDQVSAGLFVPPSLDIGEPKVGEVIKLPNHMFVSSCHLRVGHVGFQQNPHGVSPCLKQGAQLSPDSVGKIVQALEVDDKRKPAAARQTCCGELPGVSDLRGEKW